MNIKQIIEQKILYKCTDEQMSIIMENALLDNDEMLYLEQRKNDFYFFLIDLYKNKKYETIYTLINILPEEYFKDPRNNKTYFFYDSTTTNFFDVQSFEKLGQYFNIDFDRVVKNLLFSKEVKNNKFFWDKIDSNPDFVKKYIRDKEYYIGGYILYKNFVAKAIFSSNNTNKEDVRIFDKLLSLIDVKRENIEQYYMDYYIKGLITEDVFTKIKKYNGLDNYPNLSEQADLINKLDEEILMNFPLGLSDAVVKRKIDKAEFKDLKLSSLSLFYFDFINEKKMIQYYPEIREAFEQNSGIIRRYLRDQGCESEISEQEHLEKINHTADIVLRLYMNDLVDSSSIFENIKNVRDNGFFEAVFKEKYIVAEKTKLTNILEKDITSTNSLYKKRF